MIGKTQDEITKKWPKNYDKPLVSIRCLTYNHEPYIAQTLDGFLMQETDFPFEVVVHDDASTDFTAEIIRKYAIKYPKIIKPIYETENQYSKRNGSIRKIMNSACKGKYIAYCEGDDYWTYSFKLQEQVDLLEKKSEISLIHTNFETVDEFGSKIKRQSYNGFDSLSIKEDGLVSLFKKNHIMTLSVVLRKEVLFSVHYEKCPYRYDYALFFAAAFCGKIKYIPQKMGAYRKHSTSLMQTKSTIVNKKLEKVYFYYADYFLNTKATLPYKDVISIIFSVMTHAVIWKNFQFLIKMIIKKPSSLSMFPFVICFVFFRRFIEKKG